MKERVVTEEAKLRLALEQIRGVCIDYPSVQGKFILRVIERVIGAPSILNFPDVKRQASNGDASEEVEHDPPGC